MPAFGPLQLNKQEEKKDRIDLAIFASKRKELDDALAMADVGRQVKKVQGEGDPVSTLVLTAF